MTKTRYLFLTFAAMLVLSACGAPAGNAPVNTPNAANAGTQPAAAVPSKEALMANETKAWGSWKAKDTQNFLRIT